VCAVAVPPISASYAGFAYGQGPVTLGTAPSCSTTSTHSAASGPRTLPTCPTRRSSDLYTFSYHDGSFHVGKATLDVTASSPADSAEGDAVPPHTGSDAGFGHGQGPSDLGTAPSCSTTYMHTAASGPGTYPTSCPGGVSGNYTFSYHDGSFHVGKATLDVTASSPADIVYGDAVPTITASYAGFAYGQTATNLTTAPSCSTTYTHTAASGPGTYPRSEERRVGKEYTFSYHHGSFHVGKATTDG